MKRLLGLIFMVWTFASLQVMAAPQTYYVVAGHTPPGGDGSVGSPFYSIQEAISNAAAVSPAGSNHTINVAAGAYHIGLEESRIPDSDGIASTYSILDIPNNANLTNLTIVGVGRDVTSVDAMQSNLDTRVICITSPGTRISGITFKGGKLYRDSGWAGWKGAGMYLGTPANNVWFDDIAVTNCVAEQTDGPYPQGIVTAVNVSGFRADHLRVTGNTVVMSDSGNRRQGVLYLDSVSSFFLSSSRIYDNTTTALGAGWMAVVEAVNSSVISFEGSSIYHHTIPVIKVEDSSVFTANFLNCTFADNDTSGSSNNVYYTGVDLFSVLTFINCIVKENLVWTRTDNLTSYLKIRDSNVGGIITAKVWTDGGGNFTNVNPQLDANYVPTLSSPGLDKGLAYDGTGYKYVDFDFVSPGTYNQGTDVIVEVTGYTPVFADFVATTDVLGNPRMVNSKIDMGAYEYQSSTPVVTIGSIPFYTNSLMYANQL